MMTNDMQNKEELERELQTVTEQFAVDLLKNKLPDGFSYHNLDHTCQVVNAVQEIGRASNLSENEINTLILAAWFHDLGYVETYEGHEEVGMKMAREFFTRNQVHEDRIDEIVRLIEATKYNQAPRNLAEKTIKDADLYNLTTPDALQNAQSIREEWEIFRNEFFSDKKWNKMNLYFLEEHQYYTEYGREVLAKGKDKNINKLKTRMEQKKAKELNSIEDELLDSKSKLKKLKKKLKKLNDQRPDRGIETMFRNTYRVHINLSSIADNKANILLSINAIIISIVISAFVRLLDVSGPANSTFANFPIAIPSSILVVVSLSTIVFAILSTRPQVSSGVFTKEDILNKKTNLLFFGNFYKMEIDDYLWGINEMMNDSNYLYSSMSKDIYFLGRVLARKFRLLRIAYNIFMYGMIIVVLAFIWAFLQ